MWELLIVICLSLGHKLNLSLQAGSTSTPAMCGITATFPCRCSSIRHSGASRRWYRPVSSVISAAMPRLQRDRQVQVYQVLSVVCYGAASASIMVGRTIGGGATSSGCKISPSTYAAGPVRLHRTVLGLLIFLCAYRSLRCSAVRSPRKQRTSIPCSSCWCSPSRRSAPRTRWRAITASSAAAATPEIQRQDEYHQHVAYRRAVLGNGGFLVEVPPVVVFFLLKWDQLYKIISVAIRLHSWKWVKKVTHGRIPQKVKIEFILSLWGSLPRRALFLHRVSGHTNCVSVFAPAGRLPFSTPADRGTRTAAGEFA